MKIDLPQDVRFILETIRESGYEAYVVGGCVRDCLLGKKPVDWDITTSALPHQIEEIFPKTIDTGIQHGTVTVMLYGEGYEVTTYRIDGEYEDGRHPREVAFTGNLLEDLKRRDFTINAMAYNERQGIVDAFGGKKDLEEGIIRCVGNALSRFEEDALRLMRAVRFSAQLGCRIEEETAAAMRKMAPGLAQVSAERIQVELIKLLTSAHPDYLRIAWENGLTKVFLPEFDKAMETPQNHPHHCYSVGEHILHSLMAVEADKVLRLTMLLHDIGKPGTRHQDENGIDHFYGHGDLGEKMAVAVLRRLKMDRDTIDKVSRLVKYHDLRPKPVPKVIRKVMVQVGPQLFELLLKVQKADILAQAVYKREEKLEALEAIERAYKEVVEAGDCLSLKEMAITGKDLLALGMQPGKEMGAVLNRLFEYVLENPEKNRRDILLSLVQQQK